MSDSTLTIGVLLPDMLGTYGDTGNATVLAQRARWRGIDAAVLPLPATAPAAVTCDVYLLGGGEDAAQDFAVSWLDRYPALLESLDGRSVTLAVCAGMQILGRTLIDAHGRRHPGVGLLDLTTAPGSRRAVGDIATHCAIDGVGLLTGFENHQGVTQLGEGVAPLGTVITGVGNGASNGGLVAVDGALTPRIVATYLHGPVLARNPALADHLLERATGQTLPALDVPDVAALRRQQLTAAFARPRPRLARRNADR